MPCRRHLQEVGEVTFLPDFEFGLWNAWMIIVAFLLASFVPLMVGGDKTEARMEEDSEDWSRRTRIGVTITHVILMPFTLIYSFFVPLETGTWWLYLGLAISTLGIGVSMSASILFATARLDLPITDGAYAISRHPLYVASSLVYFGVGLAGTSWVFLVCAILNIVAYALVVPEEEREMVAKFGGTYEGYMRRTPRWVGWPRAEQHHPVRPAP